MAHGCKTKDKKKLNRRVRRVLKNTNVTALGNRYIRLGKGYVHNCNYGPNKRYFPEVEE